MKAGERKEVSKRELSLEELEKVAGGATLTYDDVLHYLGKDNDKDAMQIFENTNIFCFSGNSGACMARINGTNDIRTFVDPFDAVSWCYRKVKGMDTSDIE